MALDAGTGYALRGRGELVLPIDGAPPRHSTGAAAREFQQPSTEALNFKGQREVSEPERAGAVRRIEHSSFNLPIFIDINRLPKNVAPDC